MKGKPIGCVTGVLLLALSSGLAPVVRAGDGVVALQTADPACPDDSGDIYVDCGNGTVTDNRTGLVWLKDANCLSAASGGGMVDWHTAMDFVAGLSDRPAGSSAGSDDCGLSDGSSPGEWRLPSVEEWEAMVADAVLLGCNPTITDDQGTGCWISDPLVCVVQGRTCSFSGVESYTYWSSTTSSNYPTGAWQVNLVDGDVHAFDVLKTDNEYFWPVRGGQ